MARQLYNGDLLPWLGPSEWPSRLRGGSLTQPHRAKRQRQRTWTRRKKLQAGPQRRRKVDVE
jgi:hypothetical protein